MDYIWYICGTYGLHMAIYLNKQPQIGHFFNPSSLNVEKSCFLDGLRDSEAGKKPDEALKIGTALQAKA